MLLLLLCSVAHVHNQAGISSCIQADAGWLRFRQFRAFHISVIFPYIYIYTRYTNVFLVYVACRPTAVSFILCTLCIYLYLCVNRVCPCSLHFKSMWPLPVKPVPFEYISVSVTLNHFTLSVCVFFLCLSVCLSLCGIYCCIYRQNWPICYQKEYSL